MENNRKLHVADRPSDKAGREWQDSHPKKLFYKIGEVCEIADIPPHVLRYWETEFPSLKPVKNSAGQRVYRPKDIELILTIRRLLYEEGFTISGARKKIREGFTRPAEPAKAAPVPKALPPKAPQAPAATPHGAAPVGVTLFPDTRIVGEIRAELQQILEKLEKKPGT
jgi:DNA-binding transcriptional MerR regulator